MVYLHEIGALYQHQYNIVYGTERHLDDLDISEGPN